MRKHPRGVTQGGTSLSGFSVPEGAGKHDAQRPPTKADAVFCEQLAEELEVKPATTKTAFLGEPEKRALGVAEWAMGEAPDDPGQRAKMIVAWAKKRRAGAFREDPSEFVSLAGSVGGTQGSDPHYRENEAVAKLLALYWMDNPRRLARVLDDAEIWFNAEVNGGGA